jgi:hypothetical protein
VKKASKEHVVLITNLLDVSVDTGFGKIRLRTNALALSDLGAKCDGPRYRLHGFHNETGNLVFDMVLPSFDWTIEPQDYKRAFALCVRHLGDPPVRIMLFTDFANDEPLDIESFEVTAENRDWSKLLLRKVLRYYHPPYFILGQQIEAAKARQALGVESVLEDLRKEEA